jgi:hypothetical protein
MRGDGAGYYRLHHELVIVFSFICVHEGDMSTVHRLLLAVRNWVKNEKDWRLGRKAHKRHGPRALGYVNKLGSSNAPRILPTATLFYRCNPKASTALRLRLTGRTKT